MKLRKLLALAMAAVLAVSSASVALADDVSVGESDDLATAISNANEGDTIKLTGDVALDQPITITKDLIIKGGKGGSITNTKNVKSLFLIQGDAEVKFDGVKINTASNHAIQVYGDGARLLVANSTINGGAFTSILVNGAYAKLHNSTFNSNGYATVEYGVGERVTSLPKIELSGGQQVKLYVDASTIEHIQANVPGYQNMTADEIATAIQNTVEGEGATWDVAAPVVPDDNTGSNRSDNDDNSDYFGNETWDEVKREIAEAEEGDTIKVSATGLPYFPSSVARALKGLDITLEVRKNGVTYEVNGLEIGDIDKIWYEFDELETELLTADADSEAPAAEDEDKDNPDTGR